MDAVSRVIIESNIIETLCLREQCVEQENKLDISSLVTALSATPQMSCPIGSGC
jgi:hypothetical protein